MAHPDHVAAIPYSAQAKGYFDKVLAAALDEATARAYDNPANRVRADVLSKLALRAGATPTQVALNILTRGPVPTVPVIGPRTVRQIESSFDSLSIELSDDDLFPQLAEPS
jgi:aryl-alcohol dehydrogenase-like predicted oxidoreductase